MGHSATWTHFQMTQYGEEWLIHQMGGPPFRRTLTGWRNGPKRISWNSAKGRNSALRQYRLGQTNWKAAVQKNLGFWWTQSWTWESNESLQQRRPRAPWAASGRVSPDWGRWSPLSTSETYLECWVQCRAPQNKRGMNVLEKVQWRATKKIKGLDHLLYEDRLRELGPSSLENTILRGILPTCINTWLVWGGGGTDDRAKV